MKKFFDWFDIIWKDLAKKTDTHDLFIFIVLMLMLLSALFTESARVGNSEKIEWLQYRIMELKDENIKQENFIDILRSQVNQEGLHVTGFKK
jgi:hypothetical protein